MINFGNEIRPIDFQNDVELTKTLRDTMATLKWEIWEKEHMQERASLPTDYSRQFRELFEQKIDPYDTPQTIEQTRFHTKAEVEQNAVLTHLDKLIPCKENIFLFRKR